MTVKVNGRKKQKRAIKVIYIYSAFFTGCLTCSLSLIAPTAVRQTPTMHCITLYKNATMHHVYNPNDVFFFTMNNDRIHIYVNYLHADDSHDDIVIVCTAPSEDIGALFIALLLQFVNGVLRAVCRINTQEIKTTDTC